MQQIRFHELLFPKIFINFLDKDTFTLLWNTLDLYAR